MSGMAQKDRVLLEACFNNDEKAAESFIRRFSGVVYHAVRSVLVLKDISFTADDIRELHNSVFLHLFEKNCGKLRQYKGKNGCSLATWMRVVATRVVLNEVRKKGFDGVKSRKFRKSFDDLPELFGKGNDALSRMYLADRVRLLQSGMETLGQQERRLLELLYFQEKSMAQIAENLSISIQNIYTRKHRAIQKLKAYFHEHPEKD